MKLIAHLFLLTIFLVVTKCYSQEKQIDFLSCDEICQIGSRYIDWFYSSNLDSMIVKVLDKNYKLAELKKFRIKVASQLGDQVAFLNEQFGVEPWQNYYIQYHQFEKSKQPVRTLFSFNDKGMILQFSIQSLSRETESRFSNYQVKSELSLPFKGKWFVAWGGRNINENQHAVSRSQRYAYDFVIRNGCKTFEGSGKANSDYYCYEQQVIAPALGRIVEILNHVEENKVGQQPEIHGNRIVIDHGHNEFSILGHLKKGSIVVKVNDLVQKGQLLGLCGNNGHSSEPHIHYHLQNSSDIDNGDGLPIKFHSYFSNNEFVQIGEPKIGEWIQNHEAQ